MKKVRVVSHKLLALLIVPQFKSFKLRDVYRRALRTDPCCYCGGVGGTIEHILPLSNGGTDALLNMSGACESCNNKRASQNLLMFLVSIRIGEKNG